VKISRSHLDRRRVLQDLNVAKKMEVVTTIGLIIITVAAAGFWIHYVKNVVGKPELHCRTGTKLHSLLQKLQVIKEEYRPTFWCYESRLQTILASLVRHTLPDISYTREVLTFTDGGQAGLDWHGEVEGAKNQPIVLILPGLTGSSQSEYVKTFVTVAKTEVGARCCVFNYRGRGGVSLASPRTYCASDPSDLGEVIDHLSKSRSGAPVLAVGISLGGIILGHYLVREGESAKVEAALLVSVCFDTFEGCNSLEGDWLNRQLNRHLTKLLVESIESQKQQFETTSLCDIDEVFSSTTIREFDTRFTAPMFGYSSWREYYAAARLADKLASIKVPTLALNALDDPFQPGDSIPFESAASSSHVAILATQHGGHIGFMEGALPTRYHFSDRVFSQYLKAVFESHPDS